MTEDMNTYANLRSARRKGKSRLVAKKGKITVQRTDDSWPGCLDVSDMALAAATDLLGSAPNRIVSKDEAYKVIYKYMSELGFKYHKLLIQTGD